MMETGGKDRKVEFYQGKYENFWCPGKWRMRPIIVNPGLPGK